MSTLFGKKRKRRTNKESNEDSRNDVESSPGFSELKPRLSEYHIDEETSNPPNDSIHTFANTGLLTPLVDNCRTLGLNKPTDIQRFLIPFLLRNRRDPVVALASTGTGKTAAFALPILHHLSSDPSFNYAVILTPTRELAQQIHQQIIALGVPYKVSSTLAVGGIPTNTSFRTHCIVATPGRLGTLLRTAVAPNLKWTRYLVLDEADRLLSPTSDFGKDVSEVVQQCCSNVVQTVLLSATMTASLRTLQELVGDHKRLRTYVAKDVGKVVEEETPPNADDDKIAQQTDEKTIPGAVTMEKPKVPAGLVQEYLFIPDKIREAYLLATIRTLVVNGGRVGDSAGPETQTKPRGKKRRSKPPTILAEPRTDGSNQQAKSAIIFVATCERTALISSLLEQVGVANVALHSVISQDRRLAALAKFRDHRVRILVATDVAARGLDLEHVDLVINASVPRNPVNYVHRVGRTARAGRRGRSVTLVSEREVDLVQAAEAAAGRPMEKCTEVTDAIAVPLLGTAAKALRLAKLKLQDIGFDELLLKFKERKVRARKERERRNEKLVPHTD